MEEASLAPRKPGALARALRRQHTSLLTDLSAGALVAFISSNFCLSYAALLFGGTPPETQAQGVVMLLTGSVVAAVVGLRMSSLPFVFLAADGTTVALLATVTADVVATMAGAPSAAIAATLAITLMVASATTGVALWLIGVARAGGVIRYLPFQVVAGVLAASGWALSVGGATVASGHVADLAMLTDLPSLQKLAPALGLAVALLAVSARSRNTAMLPVLIVLAAAGFHAIVLARGGTLAEERAAGWLLDLPPHLTLAAPWSPNMLAAVDWPILMAHAGSLLALVPVTAIALLLNLSGIEAGSGRDVAENSDLKACGVAAVAAGALGGVLAIPSVSRTMLLYNMGVRGRTASLFAGLAAGVVPFVFPEMVGLVPRFVLGGLLLFTGLGTLRNWVIRSRRRLTWSEWLTVLAVLGVAARFGLVVAVSTGLLLGCITFAVIYSRGSPIRASYRGSAARSNVERSEAEQAFLAEQADTMLVLHLQGFVFFGTASRLVAEIKREIASMPGRLHHLVLEFGHVQGIDSSALANFERLQRLVVAERIGLAFVAMPPTATDRLARLTGPICRVASLDAAFEWREAAMLATVPTAEPPTLSALLHAEFDDPAEAATFLTLLERVEYAAGEVMMAQGELSDDLMFIEHGRASVTVRFHPESPPMRVRTFGVGTMAGEIGFCLGLPRTATVTAEEPCRVRRFTRAAMHRLEAEQPAVALAFQRAILRRLGARLLDKDHLIAALVQDRTAVHSEAPVRSERGRRGYRFGWMTRVASGSPSAASSSTS